ncbi:ras-related protein Rab-32-like protein [Dinothrombium tinctorium]|uniref:Ras-related protein Rab n=1 Tax=Dinothrombium tinctorium TaxID=1965070 RepID=A0A3S3NZ31_9ACAR|nr:ras-related protein Rab-32-like protein [Dinothrombium tinctorium]
MPPNKKQIHSEMNEPTPVFKEYLFKILVIGELASGKTSFIRRYVHQLFSTHYRATIGVDFALKVLNWDENSIIRLQLWDIAGQERFGSMTRIYYKDAVVGNWKRDLDSKVTLSDGSNIPCVLLANKCDLPKEEPFLNASFIDKYCQDEGFIGWYFTSAKENINIEESASFLVSEILQRQKVLNITGYDDDIILADRASLIGFGKRNCAC